MPRLVILAIGFALGAASVLWLIGRSMVTPEDRQDRRSLKADIRRLRRTPSSTFAKLEDWAETDSTLPPFDPHLWRERMR